MSIHTRSPLFSFKSVIALSGLMLMAACAKHAMPTYYDSNGNVIPFSKYKLAKMCTAPKRLEIANDTENTLNKLGNRSQFRVQTVLTKDDVPALPEAATPRVSLETINSIRALINSEIPEAQYPVSESVIENSTSNNALHVTTTCENLKAVYMGPGTKGIIDGDLKDIGSHKIVIEGVDSVTNQTVTVTIVKDMPKRATQKKALAIAEDKDAAGIHTFKISMVKKTELGDRKIEFVQTVVDDVSAPVEIDPALLAIYKNMSAAAEDKAAAAEIAAIADASKIEFSVLMAARKAIANVKSPVPEAGLAPAAPAASAAPAAPPAPQSTPAKAPAAAPEVMTVEHLPSAPATSPGATTDAGSPATPDAGSSETK